MEFEDVIKKIVEKSVISKNQVFAIFQVDKADIDFDSLKDLKVDFKGFVGIDEKEMLMAWGKDDWKTAYPYHKEIKAIAKNLGYKLEFINSDGYAEKDKPLILVFEDIGFVVAPRVSE